MKPRDRSALAGEPRPDDAAENLPAESGVSGEAAPPAEAAPSAAPEAGAPAIDYRDRWLRTEADLQNYRRRAQRELEGSPLASPPSDGPSLEEGEIGPRGRRAGPELDTEPGAELPAFSISDDDTQAAPVVGPRPAGPATRAAGARTGEVNPARAPEDL